MFFFFFAVLSKTENARQGYALKPSCSYAPSIESSISYMSNAIVTNYFTIFLQIVDIVIFYWFLFEFITNITYLF